MQLRKVDHSKKFVKFNGDDRFISKTACKHNFQMNEEISNDYTRLEKLQKENQLVHGKKESEQNANNIE